MATEKQAVVGSMNAITLKIYLSSEGTYMYDVYDEEMTDDSESVDGGECTGNMGDALDMARDAALAVVRNHFSDNCFNNDVCSSSLDENGEPMTDGETDHIWDTDTDPITCAECGAEKITD